MKVGDLVKAKPSTYGEVSAPIVREHWVGLIIDFTGDYCGPAWQLIARGGNPIVYWNSEFNSEIELSDQIEVI